MTIDRPHAPTPFDSEIALLFAAAGLVAGLLTAVAASAQEPEPSAPSTIARQHLEQGRPSRAVFHLRRHLDRHPDDLEARGLLAQAYAGLGLQRSALAELHLVLAERPDDAPALRTLAEVQARAGLTTEALTTLSRLRDHAGEGEQADPDLAGLRGRLLFRAERHLEAAEPLRDALQQRPDDVRLLKTQGLNALRIGTGGSLDEALHALERAATLAPDDASIHNTLGFVHERRGDVESAWLSYAQAENLSSEPAYARNRSRLESALGRN